MIQSRGFLSELLVGTPYVMLHAGKEALKKGITLAKNTAPRLAKKAKEYYVNKGMNEINKKLFIK